MLITDKVLIKMNGKHISKYRDKGYNCNVNEIIEVDIKDVPLSSKIEIETKCDVCGDIIKTTYHQYNLSIKNGGFYSCFGKCSNIKVKDTNLNKYGVDAPAKNKTILEKMKNTYIEKYGVDNPSKSENVKIKKLLTNIENGYDNPFQSADIKVKIKQSNLIKYGVDNPSKSEEIKARKELTSLKNYGVRHHAKSPLYQERLKQIRIENGNQVPDELLDKYLLYRRKVDNKTDTIKKLLFEKWDGYDYYDNEYIKNNSKEDKNNYPSIDHKKSVYYGFINNLPIEEIACLENMCITKICLNSQKGRLNEEEYRAKYY
jgi:hypothetical protein